MQSPSDSQDQSGQPEEHVVVVLLSGQLITSGLDRGVVDGSDKFIACEVTLEVDSVNEGVAEGLSDAEEDGLLVEELSL